MASLQPNRTNKFCEAAALSRANRYTPGRGGRPFAPFAAACTRVGHDSGPWSLRVRRSPVSRRKMAPRPSTSYDGKATSASLLSRRSVDWVASLRVGLALIAVASLFFPDRCFPSAFCCRRAVCFEFTQMKKFPRPVRDIAALVVRADLDRDSSSAATPRAVICAAMVVVSAIYSTEGLTF